MVSEKARAFILLTSNELSPNSVTNSPLRVSKEDYVGKPALPPPARSNMECPPTSGFSGGLVENVDI